MTRPPCGDGPLLVPFSFWLPTSGHEPQGRDQVDSAAASSTRPPGDPATATPGTPSPQELAAQAEPAAMPPAASRGPATSLAALEQAMAEQLSALGHPGAEPLRWAVTGTDPQRGLRLEGIGLSRAAEAARHNDSGARDDAAGQARSGFTPATDPI